MILSPIDFFIFKMMQSTGFHGKLCEIKNWNTSSPIAALGFMMLILLI